MSLSAALTKSFLNPIADAMANEYNLESSEVRSFLAQQFKKRGKTPRDKSKPARTSGWMVFCNENRAGVVAEIQANGEQASVPVVGKRLGEMWRNLSEAEQGQFKSRATEINSSNGFAPTPSAGKSTGRSAGKAASKTKTAASTKSRSATTAPAAAVQVVRHKPSGQLIIKGTQYTVVSTKNHAVTGRVRGSTVGKLTAADLTKCQENGWSVQQAESSASSAPAKKTRGRKTPAPVQEENNSDAGSDDEDSD